MKSLIRKDLSAKDLTFNQAKFSKLKAFTAYLKLYVTGLETGCG